MFGILKKKLKEVLDKVSGKTEKKNVEKIEQQIEEKKELETSILKEDSIDNKEDVKDALEKEPIDKEIAREEPISEDSDSKLIEEIEEKERKLNEKEDNLLEEMKKEGAEELIDKLDDNKEEEVKESADEEAFREIEKTTQRVKEDKKIIEEIEEEKRELEEIKEKILEEHAKTAEPAKKFSLFKRIKEKTLSENDVRDILSDIKHALLENDVALEVTEKIYDDVKNNLIGKDVPRTKAKEIIELALRDAIYNVLNQEKVDIAQMIQERNAPLLVIFLGFNGVGKTTTLARIAHKYKKYKPVLAAGDTFRAASIEQLEEHGKRLSANVVKHRYGADSAAVIFDAMRHASATGSKLVLADTAGRAHTNANLMDELKKVCRVNKPDLKILVLDALTGNDIYEQARLFDQGVGVDAIILTKTDVYEKGGAALSAAYTIKKPILFLGTGQDYDDLVEFDAEKIVKNLLG